MQFYIPNKPAKQNEQKWAKLPDTKPPYNKENISEMPGLILIFECDIGIFIIFSPLQA